MYEIIKYFDDHFEGVKYQDLSKEEADKKAHKLNLNTAYVNYVVRKQTINTN